MKKLHLLFMFALIFSIDFASAQNQYEPFDARHWGVVLDHPDMKKAVVKSDVVYLQDAKGVLKCDLYLPPGLKAGEKRPAVVFLNGIGEQENEARVKNWAIYSTWPALMAAHGFVGISMESDGARIPESIAGLFAFLSEKGATHHVDATRLGVYAASANVTASASYLMADNAYKGIKAAVLYYGAVPPGPYRKDLPVLYVVAEGDVNGNNYAGLWVEALKNKAPWTIKMASAMPHGFDAFEDTDEARVIVNETISFWKNHLEPVVQPSWKPAPERAIVAASYWHRWDQVIALSKQWLKAHPGDERADNIMARALINSGQFGAAEPLYAKLLSKKPDNTNLLVQMLKIKYALGQLAEARQLFAKVESAAKTPDRFLYTHVANFLYERKMYEESAAYYGSVTRLFNHQTDYYNMACCYALAGQKDKAFEALNLAVDQGFDAKQHYENDTDLDTLRSDERYKKLSARLK